MTKLQKWRTDLVVARDYKRGEEKKEVHVVINRMDFCSDGYVLYVDCINTSIPVAIL